MHKGDMVIADHPDRESRELTRTYGKVKKVLKGGNVTIEMADGSVITRNVNSIAVYIQPPPNWPVLFNKQVVPCKSKKRSMFNRQKS